MTKEEQLDILNEGVEVWNKWREKNPEIQPDLQTVDLCGMDLNEVNFKGALLNNANLDSVLLGNSDLMNAHLNQANLGSSFLIGANLMVAELKGANLQFANLTSARLLGADLTDAFLFGTILSGSSLGGANFKDATMACTRLTDLDLSQVHNLESVKHQWPSSIGIDTIYRSKGNIPETFLRGAGTPDNFIDYMTSLTGEALEFYSCFISYSTKDEEFAQRLYDDLKKQKVQVYFAPEDLKIGERIRHGIDEAIRIHDKLLLILSMNSIESEWVEKEVETAFEQERQHKKSVLFPVRLDDSVMETEKAWAADIRRGRQIGNFTGWKNHDSYQQAFDRLLRDLKS